MAGPRLFPITLRWSGPTVDGALGKDAEAAVAGKPAVPVSSGAEFGGSAGRWNPEELLAASLSTCHMLTFLALAQKASLAVRAYEDHAEAVLETVGKVPQVTEIRVRPRIVVAAAAQVETARELCVKAARYCFIGNSIKSRVVVEPDVVPEG